MAIRLLALDLDGTLLNSRGQVSAHNRSAIEKVRERGVRVALATGRRFRDARPVAAELDLDAPLISHNGALTKHARSLETVAVYPLPLAEALRALQVGRRAGAGALVSDDHEGLGILLYDALSRDSPALAAYIAWARRLHGEAGVEAVREIPSLEDYLDHEPVHITFSGRCAPMGELSRALHAELGDAAKIFSTIYAKMDFTLVDVVHPAASKGAGVAAAAAEIDVSPAEVMAIGDNFNDLEMLRFAGTGVVMANAEAELLTLPGLQHTATNDEDGVALAIEKFILN